MSPATGRSGARPLPVEESMHMLTIRRAILTGFLLAILASRAMSDPPTEDVAFATVGDHPLKLDLSFPHEPHGAPLVVFIHGGGWSSGSYKQCYAEFLTDYGFAVASISYRLSDQATFPAQIHDCKAAIRWLRAHAAHYSYDATRIGAVGTSAGGHLAMLLGVTGDHDGLEGEVGRELAASSRIQAVVSYFAPSDFVYRSRNQPSKTEDRQGSVYRLLGGAVSQNIAKSKLASPVYHVTADDPPLLMLHGRDDKVVLPDQTQRMKEAYQRAGADVTVGLVDGAGHGGPEFATDRYVQQVVEFLTVHLKSRPD